MPPLLSRRALFAFRRGGRPISARRLPGGCLPLCAILALAAPAAAQCKGGFSAPTPLPAGSTLIVGFLAHYEESGDATRPGNQLAARLRALALPGVYVETAGGSSYRKARDLLLAATGRSSKGECGPQGCRDVRLLLYGTEDGSAEMMNVVRKLKSFGVPVALAVEVTSEGRCGGTIPSNVARAANICLDPRWADHGRERIRAEDPARTEILANLRLSSGERWLDISEAAQSQPNVSHPDLHMELDPIVWNHVEDYILEELHRAGIPGAPAPPHPVSPSH